jgi:xanthine dehydrogenase accessory factor
LLKDGIRVEEGMKAGDIDPRGKREQCYSISDKARAIAGGVLEAIFHSLKDL